MDVGGCYLNVSMITFRDALRDADLPPALARAAADAGVIDAVVGIDRMIASLTASKLRLIDFAHQHRQGAGSHDLDEREFRAEIAAALRISERGAANLIDEAEVITRHLPATHAALADGLITPRQASVLVDELADLDEAERGAIEADALAAAEQSATAFARMIRRLREKRAPEQAIDRHQRARENRHVTFEPGSDGMAWLIARVPAPEAVAADSRLDDLARGLARLGDGRTIAQLRADALLDVLLDRDGSCLRLFGNARPTVLVTVPITLLAGDDATTAELSGYGPIDAETARRLVSDAPALRRILTDPRDDTMLSLGRTRYRPTDDLRLLLTARDERCRFPNCHRPATVSDLDHSRAWDDGGGTDPGNLGHLCRSHHTLKHQTRWRIEAHHADGRIDWVSPAGRRYSTFPARAARVGSAR